MNFQQNERVVENRIKTSLLDELSRDFLGSAAILFRFFVWNAFSLSLFLFHWRPTRVSYYIYNGASKPFITNSFCVNSCLRLYLKLDYPGDKISNELLCPETFSKVSENRRWNGKGRVGSSSPRASVTGQTFPASFSDLKITRFWFIQDPRNIPGTKVSYTKPEQIVSSNALERSCIIGPVAQCLN